MGLPQRSSRLGTFCAFGGGVARPAGWKFPAAGSWAGERSPISTIRTEEARFCTSSAPCEGASEGLPLDGGAGIEVGFGLGLVLAPISVQIRRRKPAARKAA